MKTANDHKVICGECQAPMELRYSYKFKSSFWGCTRFPDCRGTHGAHPNGAPLGVPANKETKEWRMKAHDAFDKIWKTKGYRISRKEAYRLLAEGLDMKEVHVGESDIEMCKKIISMSKSIMSLIR